MMTTIVTMTMTIMTTIYDTYDVDNNDDNENDDDDDHHHEIW